MRRISSLIVTLILGCGGLASAWAAGPAVPAGTDPGGAAIAIIGGGIDYREASIARRLARDGESELIGRDVIANDARPFEAAGTATADGVFSGTEIIQRLRPATAVRVIPVRVAADELQSIVRGISFATQTPARIVILPMTALNGPAGELVRQAATRYVTRLFIVGLAEEPDGTRVTSSTAAAPMLRIGNLLVVSVAVDAKPEPHLAEVLVERPSGATPSQRLAHAVAEAASAAACLLAAKPAATAADLKADLLARADPLKATGGRKVLVSPCQ